MNDNITRQIPLTSEELSVERDALQQTYLQQGVNIKEFTCDTCSARFRCLLAFDLYNIDGDCLAEK